MIRNTRSRSSGIVGHDAPEYPAVVVEHSQRSLLTPTVKVFFSIKSLAYIKPELHVLSRPGTMEKIVGREDAGKWGIVDIERLWVR